MLETLQYEDHSLFGRLLAAVLDDPGHQLVLLPYDPLPVDLDLDGNMVRICKCLSSSISSPCDCTTKDEDDLEDPYDDDEDLTQELVSRYTMYYQT